MSASYLGITAGFSVFAIINVDLTVSTSVLYASFFRASNLKPSSSTNNDSAPGKFEGLLIKFRQRRNHWELPLLVVSPRLPPKSALTKHDHRRRCYRNVRESLLLPRQ
jgi:hypothetical protein